MSAVAANPSSADAWGAADMSVLDGPSIPAPPFPVEILGDWWSEWCRTAARGGSAPVDYTAVGLLAVAGSLIGNARVLAATPEWHEPPIIWAMLVGPPSAGKSPALDPLVRILDAFEEDAAVQFADTAREHATGVEGAKAHRDIWLQAVKKAAKSGADTPIMPCGADEPEKPVRPRVRLSDTTLEAAADLSAGNPKGLLLFRDELAGWWRGFNRYGGDGERQFWIQSYGARSYIVDRKTALRPVSVDRLAISVLGGVQPDVLAVMLSGEGDGFAARFLFAFPEPVQGFSLSSPTVDRAGAQTALARLRTLRMAADANGAPKPVVCSLAGDAAMSFERWWNQRRNDASDATGLWGDWLGKQGGHVLRIALIIEHLQWSVGLGDNPPEIVGVSAIDAAIGLVDTWAAHMARRAFGAAAASDAEADTAVLAKWLKRSQLKTFNAREARRSGSGPGGRLSEPGRFNDACAALVDAGLIRRVGVRSGTTSGRARLDYEVNPALSSR